MKDLTLPPRKRSRFFSDGTDEIEAATDAHTTIVESEVLSTPRVQSTTSNNNEAGVQTTTTNHHDAGYRESQSEPTIRSHSAVSKPHQPQSTTDFAKSISLHPLYAVEAQLNRRASECEPTRATLVGCPHSTDGVLNEPNVNRKFSETAIDTDRDAYGVLLPLHLRPAIAPSKARNACIISQDGTSCVAANMYTSPKRIERVITGLSSLKRKHTSSHTPPIAHIYIRSGAPDFNIFSNGFLLYPELCFSLAVHLRLADLVSLYAISRDFHTIIDTRLTTTCLAHAVYKAPQSAQIFKFRNYAEFCRNDPASRLPNPDPAKAACNLPRKIPSFRWVAFVLHREKTVHELMTIFAERGCPLPVRCGLALKKMWMLMDVPDNARRIAMVHNHHLFTETDLYFLMCFFVKLDMVANDPCGPEKRDGLRKLLLSQRGGLDTMLKVLKREMWYDKSDYLMAWVHTHMTVGPVINGQLVDTDIKVVFGVPIDLVGIVKYEYWGQKGVCDPESGRQRPYLLRPDQLAMRESIRRGVRFTKHFLRSILYGYVRPDTLENYSPRKYGRRIADWDDGDYNIAVGLGGVRVLAEEEGGDPLLDFSSKYPSSRWTVEKDAVCRQERAMRQEEARFRTKLYAISENEQGGRLG